MYAKWTVILGISLCFISGCKKAPTEKNVPDAENSTETAQQAAYQEATSPTSTPLPKVLYIDSYFSDFDWVANIMHGMWKEFEIKQPFGRAAMEGQGEVNLKIFHMDTKRNKGEGFAQNMAEKAHALIESWKPDLVITSDDNAAKYVIVPWYRNSDLPFVFCGINWDSSEYGLPCQNVTGMIEVTLLPQVLEIIQPLAKGNRIGLIASNTSSEQKNIVNYQKAFGLGFESVLVDDFDSLQQQYLALQNRCDMIIVLEILSVKGFDPDQMSRFVINNTQVPTGSLDEFIAPYAMVTCAKKGEEQGQWAAQTAKSILSGTSPADIPLSRNKKARILLNMKIAKKINAILPVELIDRATIIAN